MDRIRLWIFHLLILLVVLIAARHFFIEGDYLWTGQGARLSWSMRLKGKVCDFQVKDQGGQWERPDLTALSPWQKGALEDPYFFWRYVLALHCGSNKAVFAKVTCRAVSHRPAELIDPTVDLCRATYSFMTSNPWIRPNPGPWDPNYLHWFESVPQGMAE